MSLFESISVAVFLMVIVFVVLLCLWGIIKVFSALMGRLESSLHETDKA